ncbi:MAG: winged helix-turn-helix transcriptional regulator [Candidatus Eisenbacteria bacterium]|uniref:Winged helix-turn-helix transcriptional regulator n=1 Tax=Eiseniibacteriota bacterium TaxID=2212470 RepID=A0A956RP03_UNCEI|nr:winged helix-turn-helix transcriptional regulator [Candidatus Eisenbacteria bacterium]
MKQEVDPGSPVPLYHQIAEAIRARIERGDLAAGDALEPLREAARSWGVNLHTVRHAYTALARQGLVETRGARGTRVTRSQGRTQRAAREADRQEFASRVLEEARERLGLDAAQLCREIRRVGGGEARRETVHVVECTKWQCQSHAREIATRFDVDAREWSLEREEEPPAGTIIATYFHYNDIRRMWPERLREVTFVTIGPDPRILEEIPDDTTRVLVCERDAVTADTVASDVRALFRSRGCDVEPVVGADPLAWLDARGVGTVVLVAPRVWSSLPPSVRSHPRVLVAAYVFESMDLDRAARMLGWPEHAGVVQQP